MKQIVLRKGKEESLLRFHPWIFSGAVGHVDEGTADGDIVRVLTSGGSYIATGHYQGGSIAVRVLTFDDEPINETFWKKRLYAAMKVRECIFGNNGNNSIYRLVHGEGDNLPGLVVDMYGRTAVMQAHSIGMHLCRNEIARALADVTGVENIFYKSETTLPFMDTSGGFIIGHSDDNIATENGLRFHVDWLKGQKTGFFVDQRDNRSLVEHYSQGRRVLNMFCYTGGFSVYAMRGGAVTVHSVDSSAKAITLTEKNITLNFPNDSRHKAYCEDAFKFLEGTVRASREQSQACLSYAEAPPELAEGTVSSKREQSSGYDLIILDPPAFAKHRGALHNALKGYIRLNQKALEKIASDGILFTFSCSQVVTKDNFRNAVFTAAALAKRRVRILHQLHQPADHPINIYHPEGEYLKGLVLYVE